MSPSGFEFRGVVFFPRHVLESRANVPQTCNGFQTDEEALIAKLLVLMGIEYLHHVCFPLNERSVSPDFVFNRLFVWNGGRGDPYNGLVVLGIEAKQSETGRCFCSPLYRRLAEVHRVPIIILTRPEILKWYQYGRLPLELATRAQYDELVA